MITDVSIIIPVFNEAHIANDTLKKLRAMNTAGSYEIIVVDGNAAGNTLQAINDTETIKIKGPRGRGSQMNAGACVACGRILLFLHVDTCLPKNAMDGVISVCDLPHISGGAFDLGIDSDKPVYRLIEKIASLRSRLTRIPYGDQAIFMTKKTFTDVGGFADIPIMEDIDLMRRVRQAGHKIEFIPESVRTSPRRWENEGIVFCTFRNFFLSTLFYAGVSPDVLKAYYK